MYARMTTAKIRLDAWDEADRVTQDNLVPAAQKQKGFKGYLGIGDRDTGKAIVITLWETEADRQATGPGSAYNQTAIASLGAILADAPVVEDFEVVVNV